MYAFFVFVVWDRRGTFPTVVPSLHSCHLCPCAMPSQVTYYHSHVPSVQLEAGQHTCHPPTTPPPTPPSPSPSLPLPCHALFQTEQLQVKIITGQNFPFLPPHTIPHGSFSLQLPSFSSISPLPNMCTYPRTPVHYFI